MPSASTTLISTARPNARVEQRAGSVRTSTIPWITPVEQQHAAARRWRAPRSGRRRRRAAACARSGSSSRSRRAARTRARRCRPATRSSPARGGCSPAAGRDRRLHARVAAERRAAARARTAARRARRARCRDAARRDAGAATGHAAVATAPPPRTHRSTGVGRAARRAGGPRAAAGGWRARPRRQPGSARSPRRGRSACRAPRATTSGLGGGPERRALADGALEDERGDRGERRRAIAATSSSRSERARSNGARRRRRRARPARPQEEDQRAEAERDRAVLDAAGDGERRVGDRAGRCRPRRAAGRATRRRRGASPTVKTKPLETGWPSAETTR